MDTAGIPSGAPRTLGGVVERQAGLRPTAIALQFGEQALTYEELDRRTSELARSLVARGLGAGDRIAVLARNSIAFFELLIACGRMGAVLTPINARLTGPEIAYILADAKPRLLIAEAELLTGAANSLPPGMDLVCMEERGAQLSQLLSEPGSGPPLPEVAEWAALLQLYTSGTTGRPKGAVLAHRSLLEMRRLEAEHGPSWLQWSPQDTALVSMPLFHIGGIRTAICGLYGGARVVVLREFDPDEVLDAVAAYRVSKLFLVPSAIGMLLERLAERSADLSSLRYMLYGASPIGLGLLQRAVAAFGCKFAQVYGMTETAGAVLTLGPDDHAPGGNFRMRSAGKPLPGVRIRVVSPSGSDAQVGEIGEICISSSSNMLGYWGDPALDELQGRQLEWIATGDAGYVDDDGYIFIHDRVKDMIISGGENVYPAEVERALTSHPDISEAAVFGCPSPRWGEEVRAAVVLRQGAQLSEVAIRSFARQSLAGYKVPKAVEIVTGLPRNAAGKILRRVLRDRHWAGYDRAVN